MNSALKRQTLAARTIFDILRRSIDIDVEQKLEIVSCPVWI